MKRQSSILVRAVSVFSVCFLCVCVCMCQCFSHLHRLRLDLAQRSRLVRYHAARADEDATINSNVNPTDLIQVLGGDNLWLWDETTDALRTEKKNSESNAIMMLFCIPLCVRYCVCV